MKVLFTISFILCLTGMTLLCRAQYTEPTNRFDIGLGIGLDYGGFGGRLTYHPMRHFTLFGAAGYNLVGLGYNVGISYVILPAKIVTPSLNAMYGYNGAIRVENADQYNGTYYGFSAGAGVQIHLKKKSGYYLNLELIVPFRSKEYDDDWETIKNDPTMEIKAEPMPVAVSLGFHFPL